MNFSVCDNATKIVKIKNGADMFYNILSFCRTTCNPDNFVFRVIINK
jgi:hypothetical protein